MATDAAMMRGDRTAAPAIARRIRHALEHTLVAGVTDALATAAGGSGKLTWERGANPLLGRLAQKERGSELWREQRMKWPSRRRREQRGKLKTDMLLQRMWNQQHLCEQTSCVKHVCFLFSTTTTTATAAGV